MYPFFSFYKLGFGQLTHEYFIWLELGTFLSKLLGLLEFSSLIWLYIHRKWGPFRYLNFFVFWDTLLVNVNLVEYYIPSFKTMNKNEKYKVMGVD